MRTILTQDHATNLRDLILEYGLDSDSSKVLDFSYGKGGYWKTNYPYKLKVIRTDAVPQDETVVKKDLFVDDYSDLGMFDAAVFDPPYKYDKEVFNYQTPTSMQKRGKNSWGIDDRFSYNKTPQIFIDRVKALDREAGKIIKPDGLLFCKVMDVRYKKQLILNHDLIEDNLHNFKIYAIYVYVSVGSRTWKHHALNSHGYWMVFKRKERT